MAYYMIDGNHTETFESGAEPISNRQTNQESITLIWFDANMDSFADSERTMEELRMINDYVQFHRDLEQCVRFIESVEDEKIFLVTSGSSARELLGRVGELAQVESVFIFCMNKRRHEPLIEVYRKIQGIYDELDSLCSAIRAQIRLIEGHMDIFHFYNKNQKAIMDLSKDSSQFLWFQLFKYVVLRLPRNAQAKRQMIEACRQYYLGNPRELEMINLFERDYRPEEAIQWYSKESFVYKLVNKALRTQDIDQLYRFRFFIGDLSENLAHEHRKMLASGEKHIVVYRGGKLHPNEYKRLKHSRGKLISMSGFLSTSRVRSTAMKFAKQSSYYDDTIPILYQIECNMEEMGETVIFADIKSSSEHPEEEEILFDVSVCFRVGEISRSHSIRVIHLTACNEEQRIIKDYLNDACRQTEQTSAAIVFGKLMCNLGQYDKALKYFEQLLDDSIGEDLAWIHYHLGRVRYLRGDLRKARKHYDIAFQDMMQAEPPRIKDSAHVVNSLGVLQDLRGRHDKAFEYYQKVLYIQEHYYPPDDPDIARTLDNIGIIYHRWKQYDNALLFHTRALSLREKVYPSGHADIALSLNNIGMIHHTQKNYEASLEHHRRALAIQKQFYPRKHIETCHTLGCIGAVYAAQKNFNGALKYYQKALRIQELHYPSGHIEMAKILDNIAVTYEKLADSASALAFYQRALNMYEKVCVVRLPRQETILTKIELLSESF